MVIFREPGQATGDGNKGNFRDVKRQKKELKGKKSSKGGMKQAAVQQGAQVRSLEMAGRRAMVASSTPT